MFISFRLNLLLDLFVCYRITVSEFKEHCQAVFTPIARQILVLRLCFDMRQICCSMLVQKSTAGSASEMNEWGFFLFFLFPKSNAYPEVQELDDHFLLPCCFWTPPTGYINTSREKAKFFTKVKILELAQGRMFTARLERRCPQTAVLRLMVKSHHRTSERPLFH